MATTSNPCTFLIIKSSTTQVPGSDTSKPMKPWSRLADVTPNDLPNDFLEDHQNHRYESISTLRVGQKTSEVWNVTIEYSKNAHENLEIMRCAETKEGAGRCLDKMIDCEVPLYEDRTKPKVRITYKYDDDFIVKVCEYKLPENKEVVWYWWEVMQVELEFLKDYGIKDHETERVDDMNLRRTDGLAMARRSRGELTDQEKEEIELRNARMGIVEGKDTDDPEIMGAE